MNRTSLVRLGLLAAVAAGLSACGGGGGSAAVSTTPTPTSTMTAFGPNFGTDFNRSQTLPPVKPQAGDLNPLSLTTPPLPVH